jgi:hypothetical protein
MELSLYFSLQVSRILQGLTIFCSKSFSISSEILDVHDVAIYTYVKKCTLPNLAYNRVHGTFLPEICHENAIKAFIKQKFNADNRKIKECLDRLVRSSILIEERGDWYRFDPWLIKLAEKEI